VSPRIPELVHIKPEVHASQDTKYCPSAPGLSATGELAAVPVIKDPLAVMQAQGIELEVNASQASPVGQAEQAVRICPSVPTGRAVTVDGAVAEINVPLRGNKDEVSTQEGRTPSEADVTSPKASTCIVAKV
jgi:hypothetical protein